MPPPRVPKTKKRITVLLTGFGDFSRITSNPSWEIVRSFVDGETITTPDGYKITIVAHPEAVRVSYAAVDALVPRLWEEAGWDYVLHVGVGFEGGFQLETRAWVNGYVMKDVDGEAPEEGGGRMKDVHGGEGGGGEGEVVRTGVDVPWVVGLVEKEVVAVEKEEGALIVASDNPGMYLCGYTLRASLLEAGKRGEGEVKRVGFLHVPPVGKKYGIETGRKVVLKVVEGMVRCGEKK